VVDEKHFTPADLAKAWGISPQTIRELFKNEEGVLKIGSKGTRTRRAYKTLRIPESVAERVHTRLSAGC
jgi:methylphosphotriester-DNA--protein-cysteine methyltransferase